MKIGNLHITWLSPRQEELLALEIREHLRDIETRQIIARMARSEVKNYLAQIAEEAQLPFITPSRFVGIMYAALKEKDRIENPHVCTEECERQQRILHPERYAEHPFEIGGYANHPEQKVYDEQPFPPEEGM